jgi:quercetin dioxygenase-like cupin family protein
MSTATLPALATSPPRRPVPGARRISTWSLAAIVEGLAGAPGLWSGFVPSLGPERSSVHLLETDAYDVWLIGWPPDSRVEPHDHGDSAGAFTVVRGALTEYRWTPAPAARAVDAGDVVTVDPRVVHDVVADRQRNGSAISIHAYSPPLREMGFYDEDGARRAVRFETDPEAIASDRRSLVTGPS